MRWLIRVGLAVASSLVAAWALAAPGLDLSWSKCAGDGGTNNRAFACDTNAGTNLLVVSFELPADLAQVSGNEAILDVLTQLPTLPAWWDFKNVGACRRTSLSFNSTADPNNVVCVDWAQGASVGGIGAYDESGVQPSGPIDPSLTAAHRRIKIAVAVPVSGLQDLVAATQYFTFNLAIDNVKTVGTGSCSGCAEPMCVVLNMVNVTTPVLANNIFIGNPSTPGSNIVTWQGIGPNCQAVPTKNATWGQVKAIYR